MDVRQWLMLWTCAGLLGLAIVSTLRIRASALAGPLAALCLLGFLWRLSVWEHSLSGAFGWPYLTRVGLPWMPALALHFVLRFLGRARRSRLLLAGWYAVDISLSAVAALGQLWPPAHALAASLAWDSLLAAQVLLGAGLSFVLLARHLRLQARGEEAIRTWLMLAAEALVAMLVLALPLLPEAHMLHSALMAAGMLLVTTAAFGFRLFDTTLSGLGVVYAAALLSIAAGGCAIAYRGLVAAGGVLVLSAGAFGVCLMVVAVESGRALLERRARVTQLAALGRWSGYMAHDFKNPLAALKGAAQFLLEERAQGRSIDHQSRFLSLLVNETNRLARLLDRYQHFAALGAIKQPTSLNALLEQLAAQQRAGLPPEVSLELALDRTLPPCPLDAELALAALENLVRNAIEAMPHGGRVTLSTRWRVEAEALGSARKPHGEVQRGEICVAVEDTGRGMNPRELALACEDFFTTKEPGRGQGLPMVKRVVTAHGGSLHSQSRLGHGTCMTLVFPC